MLKLSSDYLKHYNVKAAGESSVNSDPRCKSMRCLVVSLAFLATCFAYFHSNRVSSPLSGGLRLLSGTRFSVQPLVLAAAAGPSRKNPELMETVDHLLDDQQQLIMIDSNDAGSSATEVMESSTKLLPASALEISFDNSIVFGNYLEKKANSNAIRVNFASGAEAWIDCSQIVSVWDTLSDEPPMNAAEWAKTLVQAELLLNQSVPRKTNLDEFWYLVRQQRSSALPIDSQDVGVYLFQESKFSSWKDPTLEAEAAKVRPLTAAQRTAAAMLLHFDGAMHFKRRPSWIAEVSADVSLTEGGYKIVDESIVCFKECEMFVQYFNDRATLQDSGSIADDVRQDSPVIRRLLRQLELYALCSSNTVRPSSSLTNNRQQGTIAAAPKVVKMILKKRGLPVTPLSARDILLKIGQRNSSVYKPLHSDLKRVMSFDTVAANDENNKHKDSVKEKNTEGVPYTLNLTPWSAVVMKEAAALQADVEAQRKKMDETAPINAGKRTAEGRMDYRQSSSTHPAVCIDTKYASFLDDAFSLCPETGELLIHVVDVAGKLRQYPALQQAAKERISTSFLPSGPLHMLPPAALESLSLSDTEVNEAITVALSVNYDTGEVLSYRVFPSILGPVTALDIHTANEIIAGVGVQTSAPDSVEVDGAGAGGDSAQSSAAAVSAGPTAELPTGKVKGHNFGSQDPLSADQSTRMGYTNALVRDLRMAYNLVTKMCIQQPWLDASLRRNGKQNSEWQIDHQQGVVYRQELSSMHSHRLVNALLSLYATSAFQYCKDNNVPVPLAWENRDRVDTSKPRRFSTQPLRNWLSQLQQKQVRAALKMELPLSQKDCALAVSHHNLRRKQQAELLSRSPLLGTNY